MKACLYAAGCVIVLAVCTVFSTPAISSPDPADRFSTEPTKAGKGREGQGVLRRNFLLWLESPGARRLVSGYAESHPKHGGAGAFYVFLRRTD